VPTLADDIRSAKTFRKLVAIMERKPENYTIAEVSGTDLRRFAEEAEYYLSGPSSHSSASPLILLGNLVMFASQVGIQDPVELKLGIQAAGLIIVAFGAYLSLRPNSTTGLDTELDAAFVKSVVDAADSEWLLGQMQPNPNQEQVAALASRGAIVALRRDKNLGAADLESSVFYFIIRKSWI
jgi:hypothetical protein